MSESGTTQGRPAVAVIGIATRLPQADTLEAFRENLREGVDSVRPIPRERVESTCLDPSVDYPELGYLDRIDLFDHEHFGLSRREAEVTDPQHRLALHLTHEVLQSAGYAAAGLRDSRTAVIFSSPGTGYAPLIREQGTLSLMGNIPFGLPARISHLFGFTGPCYGVDTGCNGSLVAVHQACRELRDGDADYAVVGGVSLRPIVAPAAGVAAFPGISSPTARSRAFDHRADGAGGGEGGAVLLLTTLERALADGAFVHAVIRGSAVLHNGAHSATIATPSARSQAEVIRKAWHSAGLDIGSAGYVEAHGSGTRLGDAVEAEGLALARPGDGRSLAVGSVKTNVGHLDHAAGITGLVKTVLSVRDGELYPSLHFERAADEVDLDGARLEVVTSLRPWRGDDVRRAGVSSFSLGGINAHCVVEQAPPAAVPPRADGGPETGTARLVGVSARTRADLVTLCERLALELRHSDRPSADIARTLNEGRDHHPYRVGVVARRTSELAAALAAEATWLRLDTRREPTAGPAPRVVFLLSGDAEPVPLPGSGPLPDRLPVPADRAGTIRGQLAAHTRLTRAGVVPDGLISSGISRYAVRHLRDDLTDADTAALEQATSGADPAVAGAPVRPERLRAAADEQLAAGPVVFVELAARGELGTLLKDHLADRPDATVLTLESGTDGVLDVLARLYELGWDPDWSALAADAGPGRDAGRRMALPGHRLRGVRCWALPLGEVISFDGVEGARQTVASVVAPPPTRTAPPPEPEPEHAPAPLPVPAEASVPGASPAPQTVLSWLRESLTELLHADDVAADDDYFAIGGNSIIGLQFVERARQRYDVHLKLVDIYDHPVVGDLAAALSARLPGTEARKAVQEAVHEVTAEPAAPAAAPAAPSDDDGHHLPPIQPGPELVLSYGQERMWFHHQLDPATTLYNLPGVSRHLGPLDIEAVRLAWEDLARRHEVLRSNFVEEDGRPHLVIRPELGDFFHYVDVCAEPDPVTAARTAAKAATDRVLDLARDPLVNVTVVRCAPDDYLMCWVMHHAVNDGWAPQIQRTELMEFYTARTEGRVHRPAPLPVQYRDYARWQRELMDGSRLDGELDYWRERLTDPPALALPTDRPRPTRMDFAGASHGFTIPAELVRELRAVGGRETATLFMVLLTGLKILLSRWSGQRDIVIGTPTIGRSRPELWDLLGFFNNTVALRSDLSGDPTFRELLRQVRGVVLGALDHQEIPFDTIVREVATGRDPGRNPVFDVMYVHQTLPPNVTFGENLFASSGGEDTGPYFPGLPPGTAKFDITVVVAERSGEDSLDVVVEYATRLFDAGTIAALTDSLLELLRAAAADADLRYGELPARPPRRPAPSAPVEPARPADDHLDYWKRALTGVAAFEVPADRSRPLGSGPDGPGACHSVALPDDLAATLIRTGARDRLLAGIAALLGRRAETNEVVIGVAERASLLPLRISLADDPTYDVLTERVRAGIAAGEDHRDVPLADIERALALSREPGRPPLCDVTYTHHRLPAGPDGGSVTPGRAVHDLAWSVAEGPEPAGLRVSVAYRTDMFDAATVTALADDLVALVRAAVHDPGAPLAGPPFTTAAHAD